MSQTLILDTGVSQVINPTSGRIYDQERRAGKRTQQLSGTGILVSSSSLFAAILSTLLLRIASRISFVLLGFYLGEHFTSATIVAVVLEAFYLSELVLAPMVGSLSDRLGHKPFPSTYRII